MIGRIQTEADLVRLIQQVVAEPTGPPSLTSIQGLRVVDASAMPYITNGNIYAPVMMMAEKAADLILGNTPLPPEPLEFYRHRKETQPA